MDIKPLQDRLLVRRLPSETKIGLIHVPDIGQKTQIYAEVLAVGPGKWDEDGYFYAVDAKPGDIVLLPGVGNTYPDWEAGQELIVSENDIGTIERKQGIGRLSGRMPTAQELGAE